MMILSEIGKIDHHVFQRINTNEYEEGNPYVYKNITNSFVEFKQQPTKLKAKSVSYFDQILEIEEGHNVIEHDKYKKSFFDNLSNDVLKNISKKHVILKQDIYEFVYSTDSMIPTNRSVMELFCVLNHKSYILVKNKLFHTFNCDEHQETFILYDKPPSVEVVFHKFQTVDDAQSNLVNAGYIRSVVLKNLKLTELKEYANLHHIKIDHLKKKDEVIHHIDTYIKNKN